MSTTLDAFLALRGEVQLARILSCPNFNQKIPLFPQTLSHSPSHNWGEVGDKFLIALGAEQGYSCDIAVVIIICVAWLESRFQTCKPYHTELYIATSVMNLFATLLIKLAPTPTIRDSSCTVHCEHKEWTILKTSHHVWNIIQIINAIHIQVENR